MANTAWSREEVEATVADYLAMLVEYHSGLPLNKAAHNRTLRQLLNERTGQSVEFKHRNISAVLDEAGLDYLDGYVPAHNLQNILREIVFAQLNARPEIRELVRTVVERSVPEASTQEDDIPELVPSPRSALRAVRERYRRTPRPRIVDFDAMEARNRSLGRAGELAVLAYEHRRLWRAGKRQLADRVEHVARTQGDGLGYDILSFESSGSERLIEVKTTRRAQLTPFYVTRNEVDVSEDRADVFHLYRLFRFERDPKLFILRGGLKSTCRLEPTAYRADVA